MSQQLLTLQSLGTEFPAADCCISFSYYQCLLQDQYFSRLITKTDSCLLEKVCFGEKKEKVCVCFCGQEKRVRERHWTLKFRFKFHFTNRVCEQKLKQPRGKTFYRFNTCCSMTHFNERNVSDFWNYTL